MATFIKFVFHIIFGKRCINSWLIVSMHEALIFDFRSFNIHGEILKGLFEKLNYIN